MHEPLFLISEVNYMPQVSQMKAGFERRRSHYIWESEDTPQISLCCLFFIKLII